MLWYTVTCDDVWWYTVLCACAELCRPVQQYRPGDRPIRFSDFGWVRRCVPATWARVRTLCRGFVTTLPAKTHSVGGDVTWRDVMWCDVVVMVVVMVMVTWWWWWCYWYCCLKMESVRMWLDGRMCDDWMNDCSIRRPCMWMDEYEDWILDWFLYVSFLLDFIYLVLFFSVSTE